MKSRLISLLSLLTLAAASAQAQYRTCLVEAEAFQFKGKWTVEKSSACLGSAMLRVYQDDRAQAQDDAMTVVNIPDEGTYHVWTRSQDFADSPRPRTYTLSVNGVDMAPSGNHGIPAFMWEHVGDIDLKNKPTLLRLSDSGKYFGRCDAILLTQDPGLDPNTLSNTEIARWRRNPATMDYTTVSAPALKADKEISAGYTTLASASNGNIRISFVRLPDDGTIVCKTDIFSSGSWRRFAGTAEDNRVALIKNTTTAPVLNHNQFYPAWDRTTAVRTFTFEGKEYNVTVDGDNTNPFFTGTLSEARATAVTKTAANCIKVTYDCGDNTSLTAYWTVPENGSHIAVRFVLKAAADGFYTIALHAAKGISDDTASGVLMPPMFAGRRFPASPLTLFSSMTTQCISAASRQESYGEASAFVCADLDAFPSDWGSYDHSPLGLTLRNSRGLIQPVALAPLPGMPDSRVKAGKTVEARFITGITPGTWTDALEYASGNIFGVTDYRRPAGCSLTETIENIAGLIGNDTFSGWEPQHKGFWDIESDGNSAPTVVHSAPLALIGAAAIMHDEELYEKRALPAIEYLLSRNGYRTRVNLPVPLDPMTSQFPTTAFEGIDRLSGNLNPWIAQIAMPDGAVRYENGYFSTLQAFRQELAAYRLTDDESRLDRAAALAMSYAQEISSDKLPDMDAGNFYNSRMVPDWTPLLDIYRVTGDPKFLDAAVHGAAHTLAGIKTWPKTADGTQTVHPAGVYDGVTTIWWKGTERFRLGFPRKPGDAPEHEVEAWTVSPVGLGIEQPATYFLRSSGKTVRPVFMSSWAPRLMELAALSGNDIFDIYGRNAVIGRAAGYPGYYATGYTDITASERFPYEGPDVSSIYYHHIPAYLAMMQDCLVTEICTRSNGDIHFEPARQEGFVWFANNVYGNSAGRILGHDARLYMPAKAVTADNAAINILTARNATHFFIMLTNDGDSNTDVKLTINPDIAKHLRTHDGGTLSATVAPRAVEVIVLDADFPEYDTDARPLDDGMEIIESDTPAGKIHIFRIRSPFGWDSVYAFAGCSHTDGLSIVAECNGRTKTASAWPYEVSFARFGLDEAADLTIKILQNGSPIKTITKTFAGASSGTESVSTSVAPQKPHGIYTVTGQRIERITEPGFYIVDGQKFYKN